jgi:NAD(P)-dependent dehydrogenase (short-subunit alcohol dehydrogenase family)
MILSENELFSLRGKTFLITGGTRGIGQAISLRFARAGARVIANYLRNEAAAEQLKALAQKEGLEIALCRADLSTDRGLERVISFLDEQDAQISGLVHCAATGTHRRLEELTERHFDFTFNLNVRAFFKLVKSLQGRLSQGSSIVAVSSYGGTRVLPYYSLIGSSKGALESLARHMAVEFASRGIRVNILTAGAVLTDAWKAMPEGSERLAEATRRNPTGRLVTADEVASGAQFLCSDAASGVVGQTLLIDGGSGIVA